MAHEELISIANAKEAFGKACGWLSTYPWYQGVAEEFVKALDFSMKANELMIGDWVAVPYNLAKISSIEEEIEGLRFQVKEMKTKAVMALCRSCRKNCPVNQLCDRAKKFIKLINE